MKVFKNVCESISDFDIIFEKEIEQFAGTHQKQIKCFEEALELHIKKIPIKTLINLTKITFDSEDFSKLYSLTEIIVKEAIRRKSKKLQKEIADLFYKNCSWYEIGHRPYAKTIHDNLIDYHFANFEVEILGDILSNASFEMLEEEELAKNYYSYFKRETNKERAQNKLGYFTAYTFKELVAYAPMKSMYEEIMKNLNEIKEETELKDEISKVCKFIESTKNYFEKKNIEDLNEVLRTVGVFSSELMIYLDFRNIIRSEKLEFDKVDYDAVEAVFERIMIMNSEVDDLDKFRSKRRMFLSLLYRVDAERAKKSLPENMDKEDWVFDCKSSGNFFGVKEEVLNKFINEIGELI